MVEVFVGLISPYSDAIMIFDPLVQCCKGLPEIVLAIEVEDEIPFIQQLQASFDNILKSIEKHTKEAPIAQHAADGLRRILLKRKSGSFTIGSIFQANIAPKMNRILPKRLLDWFLQKYYNIV